MNAATLNQQFALGTTLRFVEDPSGLIVAEIENPLASARLCLQGAHLLSWRPRSTSVPVVWLSEAARLMPGKSSHSGAPICWPWFGAHAAESGFPAHGFARNAPWDVTATGADDDGRTHITLRLQSSAQNAPQWPHASTLELHITVGNTLTMALTTTNTGTSEFVITEAFHTYFQVGDIAQAQVTGLENITYADKVLDYARDTQRGALAFNGETDRVYLNTADACVIEDPSLRRRIHIAKSGSQSTVVWTPWQEKATKLEDVGEQGWRHMLCVESANALENAVRIPAGASHTLSVTYSTEPL